MIEFLFYCFRLFSGSSLFYPMLGLIFVFGVYRLTWYLLLGGYNNYD